MLGLSSNQGYIQTSGPNYVHNNPFYTCPANTYAKVIVKLYFNTGGYLWYGNATTWDSTYGWYGTKVDFGQVSSTDKDYSTHYMGNSGGGGGYAGSGGDHAVIWLAAGEKLFRDNGSVQGFVSFLIIEYAIP